MKYRDVFDLEQGISAGIDSQSWPLLKRIAEYSRTIRDIVTPIRERMPMPKSVQKYNRELELIKISKKTQAEIDHALDLLSQKYPDVPAEAANLRRLEQDMLADDLDKKYQKAFRPIPESLLHVGDELQISANLYLTLTRLGLVQSSTNKKGDSK